MAGPLELVWANGSTEALELQADAGWLVKRVRPVARQSENESLRVWHAVRQALVAGEYQTASELKKAVTSNVFLFLTRRVLTRVLPARTAAARESGVHRRIPRSLLRASERRLDQKEYELVSALG